MSSQDVANRLITHHVPQIGQSPDKPILPPAPILRASRTTKASTAASIVGRPGAWRCGEPSNFFAMSF